MNALLSCKCLALAAFAAAFASIPLNIGAPKYLVDQITDKLAAAIAREGDRTRAAALAGIAETRADVLARVDRLMDTAQAEVRAARLDADAHIVGAVGVLDRRAESLQADLNTHGLILERIAAGELGRAVDGWVQVAQPVSAVAGQIAHAAPGILDPLTVCEGNPSCFENRWKGLTFDLEQTMRAVQASAPAVGRSAAEISGHFASIAGSADRWVGVQLAPKNKKQTALAFVERFGLIGLRAWLLL